MSEAYRITAVYADGEYRLQKAERIRKQVPPGTESIPENEVGTWVVVTSRKGAPLYVRNIINLAGDRVEVQTGDPTSPLAWVPDRRTSQLFHLVVPVYPDAEFIQFIERKPSKEKKLATTRHFEISITQVESAIREPSGGDKEVER